MVLAGATITTLSTLQAYNWEKKNSRIKKVN